MSSSSVRFGSVWFELVRLVAPCLHAFCEERERLTTGREEMKRSAVHWVYGIICYLNPLLSFLISQVRLSVAGARR